MSALPEKRERIRKYWRKPKAVLRALGSYAENETDAYHKDQILEWLNAAVPISVARLIEDVVGNNPELAQKAAINIIDRVLGRARPPGDGGGLQFSVQDGEKRLEITIVDPQQTKSDMNTHEALMQTQSAHNEVIEP